MLSVNSNVGFWLVFSLIGPMILKFLSGIPNFTLPNFYQLDLRELKVNTVASANSVYFPCKHHSFNRASLSILTLVVHVAPAGALCRSGGPTPNFENQICSE